MGAFGGTRMIATTVPPLLATMQRIAELLEVSFPGRVALDVKDINPPGLYLHPPVLRFRFAGGTYTIEHTLLVVASNTTRVIALGELGEMIQTAQTALSDRAVLARPADVWNTDQTAVLAAYELTWSDVIR